MAQQKIMYFIKIVLSSVSVPGCFLKKDYIALMKIFFNLPFSILHIGVY